MRPETLHKVVLLGIVAGLALSIWAAVETELPALQSSCSIDPFFSCSAVDRSPYSTLFGFIPDWLVGMLGFAAMLVVDIPLYRTWKRSYLGALLVLSGLGVAMSVYFLSVELLYIGAICPVCLSTYLANGVVLVTGLALWRKGRIVPESGESSGVRQPESVDGTQA